MTRTARVLAPLLACLLVFLALGSWSLSSPVGSAPDDDFHLASIWCGAGPKEGLCEPGSDSRHWLVPNKALYAVCFAFKPEQDATCQGEGFTDPGYDLVESSRLNAGSTQYPSGFYYWMSALTSENVAASTVAMRLANAALFSILLIGTWLLMPRRHRFTLVGSIALTAVPLTMFLIPSTNPSSWSIISMAIMFPALLGYFASRGLRAGALGALALIAALLGLGARGDSAAYAGVAVCAALVLAFRPDRRFFLKALLPALIVVLALVAFLGAGQTGLAIGGMGHAKTTMSTAELIAANLLNLPHLWFGIYGLGWGLGWMDTDIHPVTWGGALFSVLGVMFVAIRWQGWRKLVAVLGVAAAAVGVPLYILVSSRMVVGSEVQPRYILPLLLLLVAVVLAPSEDAKGRGRTGVALRAPQVWTIAVLLTAANAVALYDNMHRYTGQGTLSLRGAVSWWWHAAPSPLVIWLIGNLAFAATMAMFALSTIRGRTDADSPEAGAQGTSRPASPGGADAADAQSGADQPAVVSAVSA